MKKVRTRELKSNAFLVAISAVLLGLIAGAILMASIDFPGLENK